MNKVKYRISEVERLVEIGRKLHSPRSAIRYRTERTYLAEQIFSKSLLHGISFTRLYPKDKNDIESNLDVSALASISRCVIEIHHVFHYLCETKLSKDEFEFRIWLMCYHQDSDLDKILQKLTFDDKDWIRQMSGMSLVTSMEKINNNPVFHNLSTGEQKEILKGKKAYQWNLSNRKEPIPKDYEEGIYRLLSNSVHSFPLGLTNSSIGGELNHVSLLGVIFLSVESMILYLANIVNSYINLRCKLSRQLTNEDKVFVRSLINPKHLEDWLTEKKKIGESFWCI